MSKKAESQSLGGGWCFLLILVFVGALMAAPYLDTHTYIGGKFVQNTPSPPTATPTPREFSVVAQVDTVQIVGGDWDGYRTWVVIEVVKAERTFAPGQRYNLRLPADAMTDLKVGMKIRLDCTGAYDKDIVCSNQYEVIQ